MGTFQKRNLMNHELVFSPYCPNPLSSSYPACVYSPRMLCLRLLLYSFLVLLKSSHFLLVFYLTILSGTWGHGSRRRFIGEGRFVFTINLGTLFSRAGFLTMIVWFTLACFGLAEPSFVTYLREEFVQSFPKMKKRE